MAHLVRITLVVVAVLSPALMAAEDTDQSGPILLWQADEPACLDLSLELPTQLAQLPSPAPKPGVTPPRKVSGNFTQRQLRTMHRDGRHRVFTLVVGPAGEIELIAVNWSVDRRFDLGVARTIRKWKFKPGMIDGVPSCFRFDVSLGFGRKDDHSKQ